MTGVQTCALPISYYYDYGPDRGSFIDNFFDVVDWDNVAEQYQKATSQ